MKIQARSRILFLVAHPFLQESRSNRAVIDAVSEIPGLTVHRIYDLYPYFHIDAEQEKQRLLEHDFIVMQHPFYWYSMPSLLRHWLDEVLTPGWAYGSGGFRLEGKKFLLSMTIGGPESSYTPEGYNRFPMETYLAPWNQIAHLCHMKWHPPTLLYNSTRATAEDLAAHGARVRQTLTDILASP